MPGLTKRHFTPSAKESPVRRCAAVRAMEAAVVESDLDWVILRGGLFYGPGTGFDDDWFARARAGKLRLPAEGTDYVSLVHIADMAAATVAAVRRWPSRQPLIVADDCPARWRDVLTYVCAIAGSDPPQPGGRSAMPSFRVKNARARTLLRGRLCTATIERAGSLADLHARNRQALHDLDAVAGEDREVRVILEQLRSGLV